MGSREKIQQLMSCEPTAKKLQNKWDKHGYTCTRVHTHSTTHTHLESLDHSMHVLLSYCTGYERRREKGAKSRKLPGAFHTCTHRPWVTAKYLGIRK